jgi:hypothetical protein
MLYEIQGIRPILTLLNGKEYVQYPRSGILPFSGFGFLVAPLCYMSTDTNEIYTIFRSFFCRNLSYLSSFSSNRSSILSLIYNFDNLFQIHFADLTRHFKKILYDINIQVYQWFLSCFGAILSPQYSFILFDIIILSDSLNILIFLALSILDHKKSILLESYDVTVIKTIFENIRYENINMIDLLYRFMKQITES